MELVNLFEILSSLVLGKIYTLSVNERAQTIR